jgi:hypothetical protein
MMDEKSVSLATVSRRLTEGVPDSAARMLRQDYSLAPEESLEAGLSREKR